MRKKEISWNNIKSLMSFKKKILKKYRIWQINLITIIYITKVIKIVILILVNMENQYKFITEKGSILLC